MRRTLVISAEAITRHVTRNGPSTGNLPAGKGCLTERTVASTAAASCCRGGAPHNCDGAVGTFQHPPG